MLHIQHKQPARGGKTWCGIDVVGPRIDGVENFIYYAGPGTVCPACIDAILDVISVAIKTGEGKQPCSKS
jgi:hypothetical protein